MKLSELKCINKNINIEDYITYRDEIKNKMDYPEWLGDFSKEDLINLINNGSNIWMYFLNDEFICSMMMIPSNEKSLKKFEIDADYKKVVDYGPMFVNPSYRGNGLQLQMLEKLDKYSLSLNYQYAVSTVHPDNSHSINNLLKDKFIWKGTKEFKRGIRNIYWKEL